MRLVRLLVLTALACAAAAAQTRTSAPHWYETDTETVWTGRYSNCDDGYTVTLPAGVVAHGAKSPNPNHGFAMNPAAPASSEPFDATSSNRFINVISFYDVEDHEESTAGTLNYYASLGEIGETKQVAALSRKIYSLAGLSARRMEDRWVENSIAIRRDRVLAYRKAGGILYQLTLQSPEKNYAADELLFNRIVEGFHVTKLPTGECTNE